MSKSMFVLTSSIALGIGAYAAYRYWKKRESKCIDEGFEDISKVEENFERRILVLGLQGAGKTTLISQISTGLLDVSDTRPTEGFHVTNLNHGNKVLNIWDGMESISWLKTSDESYMFLVGGSENVRRFWSNFIQDTDLLIFVVDSTDAHGLVVAMKEIKTLSGDDRLKNVPIIVVATKQDLPGALTPNQVADALDIKSIAPSKHKVKVFGTSFDSKQVHPSVLAIKKAILDMV